MRRILIIILSVSLAGCSAIEKNSEDSVKDTKAGRRIARNFAVSWPMKSGVIRGAMGPSLDELPAHAIDAMDELDIICAEINADPNNIDDEKLGLSLGLRFRFCTSIVMKVLEKYAPNLVPLLF